MFSLLLLTLLIDQQYMFLLVSTGVHGNYTNGECVQTYLISAATNVKCRQTPKPQIFRLLEDKAGFVSGSHCMPLYVCSVYHFKRGNFKIANNYANI